MMSSWVRVQIRTALLTDLKNAGKTPNKRRHYNEYLSTLLTHSYLKYKRLVVTLQVEGKDIGVHEDLATLTQYVDGSFEKLNLDPRHVVLHHFLHLLRDACIQLPTTTTK